jgi:hypothetical protein
MLHGVVGTEQASDGGVIVLFGTADEHVADGDFAEHFPG